MPLAIWPWLPICQRKDDSMCNQEHISQEFDALAWAEFEAQCCREAVKWLVDRCAYTKMPRIAHDCPESCPPIARQLCLRNEGIIARCDKEL